MKRLKRLTACILTMALCVIAGHAQTNRTKVSDKTNSELTDSLRSELALVKTSADSIPILYDIYDLANYANRYETGEELYQVAVRAKNEEVQIDMLNRLSSIAMSMYQTDSIRLMLSRIESLPESQDKRIAECLIKSNLGASIKFSSEQELADSIQVLLNEIKVSKERGMDRYDRIARMFILCEYLQGFTQGSFLTEYIDRLDAEISQLPFDQAVAIRNKFYASAAMLYLRNEQFEKAVNADRKLLSTIDRIEAHNSKSERKFYDPIINRYISLRRMIKCYPALSEAETQAIFDNIMELAERNEDIRSDMEVNPLPEMALYMKLREYDKALPLLKILANNADTLYNKKYYLRRLCEAAESIGSHEDLAEASIEYSRILEEFTDLKTAERLRELELDYKYESLREDDAEKLRSHEQWVTTLAIVASVLLAIVIIAFIVMAVRLSSGKMKLARANAKLLSEGEELRLTTESLTKARDCARKADTEKTKLVNYVTNEVLNPINTIIEYSQIIIDNAQGENKAYLERFKSIIDMNVRLLLGLIADVQELAVVESSTLPVHRVPVDLNAVGQDAVDSILPQINKGVEIQFHPGGDSKKLIYRTDPRRVEIVLLNLLSNAAKFTPQGRVDLSVEISAETGDAVFTVTDTGIGVPPEKAETIFKRFERLNPEIEGSGLGLSVCRLVCLTLDATVTLDTSYAGPGSRFIFRIHPHE